MVHLLLQLGLSQQLWDEVQADMDGGDASHSEGQQSLRVTLEGDTPHIHSQKGEELAGGGRDKWPAKRPVKRSS